MSTRLPKEGFFEVGRNGAADVVEPGAARGEFPYGRWKPSRAFVLSEGGPESCGSSEDDARHQIGERVVPCITADLGQATAPPYIRQPRGQSQRGVGLMGKRHVDLFG